MFTNPKSINAKKSLIIDLVYIEYRGGRYLAKNPMAANEARTSYNVI
ncbi:MAG: hypothetical protein LBS39_02765 [Campylobacteraceae bacterium]|jgi:hypothetical protein|nr:hypothetical protein [Campylobacteraceae bacterium]